MVKNGTPASPATARARSVLPVPGGPKRRTPRGILPPRRVKRPGSRRNSTISRSSSFASSAPATSRNDTSPPPSGCIFARLFPNEKMFLPPLAPICIRRVTKKNATSRSTHGRNCTIDTHHGESPLSYDHDTPFARHSASVCESTTPSFVEKCLMLTLRPFTAIVAESRSAP